MKIVLTVFILMVFLLFSTFCSDSSTEPVNIYIEGNWVYIKSVESRYYQDEEVENNYYNEYIYNPEFDNFHSARILVITSDEYSGYQNSLGTDYNVVYELEYKKKQDRLTLIDPSTNNTVTQYCYFEDEFLVFENRGENEGDTYSEKWSEKGYWQTYDGPVPPNSWITLLQNDSYEPDDTLSTATPISVNAPAQKHVITQGDQDWFKFNTQTDSIFLIESTNYFGIGLNVYDSDLNEYETPTNNYGEPIYWNLSGEIFIKVTGDSEGYYSISVSTE